MIGGVIGGAPRVLQRQLASVSVIGAQNPVVAMMVTLGVPTVVACSACPTARQTQSYRRAIPPNRSALSLPAQMERLTTGGAPLDLGATG